MSIVTCIILLLLKVNVTQLCPTLYDPMDYMVHGVLQVRILEWVVFPFSRGSSQPRDRNQGLNPGLPNCRQILYQLSHKGSLRILEWVAYPFSSRSSQPRNWTGVSCIAGGFFTNWAIREAWNLMDTNNLNVKTIMLSFIAPPAAEKKKEHYLQVM